MSKSPAVKITLDRRSRSYEIDDFEICESKAQNRDVRPWLTSVAQQAHLLIPVCGRQYQNHLPNIDSTTKNYMHKHIIN